MRHTAMRADAQANRGRLIDAAHAVFRERGLGAEMREIAERAGVSVGTLYRNYPTRDDLVLAMVGELLDEICAGLDAAAGISDPTEALRGFLRAAFAIAERFGDLATLSGVLPAACDVLLSEFDLLARTEAIVGRARDAGLLPAGIDTEFAAARLVSSFDPRLYRRLRATRSAEALVEQSLRFFLHGAMAG